MASRKQQDPRNDRAANVEEIEIRLEEASGLCNLIEMSLLDSNERNTVAATQWKQLGSDLGVLLKRAQTLAR